MVVLGHGSFTSAMDLSVAEELPMTWWEANAVFWTCWSNHWIIMVTLPVAVLLRFLQCWTMCWYHTMLCTRIQFHYISIYCTVLHNITHQRGPSNIITYHQIIQTSDPHRPGCSLLADCLGMWRRPVTSWSESPESNPLQLNCRACRQLTEHSVAHDWETTCN